METDWKILYKVAHFDGFLSTSIPSHLILSANFCTVTLYQHQFYRGYSHKYTQDGSVTVDDDMSSLKISEGCCVTLYEHINFQGTSRKYCKSTNWVGRGWNDKVSSIKLSQGKILGKGMTPRQGYDSGTVNI